MRVTSPAGYPAIKDAADWQPVSSNTPVPSRVENGRQIYEIEIAVTEISSTYGAVPESLPHLPDVNGDGMVDELDLPILIRMMKAGIADSRDLYFFSSWWRKPGPAPIE